MGLNASESTHTSRDQAVNPQEANDRSVQRGSDYASHCLRQGTDESSRPSDAAFQDYNYARSHAYVSRGANLGKEARTFLRYGGFAGIETLLVVLSGQFVDTSE